MKGVKDMKINLDAEVLSDNNAAAEFNEICSKKIKRLSLI